jgi:hypothetical protein
MVFSWSILNAVEVTRFPRFFLDSLCRRVSLRFWFFGVYWDKSMGVWNEGRDADAFCKEPERKWWGVHQFTTRVRTICQEQSTTCLLCQSCWACIFTNIPQCSSSAIQYLKQLHLTNSFTSTFRPATYEKFYCLFLWKSGPESFHIHSNAFCNVWFLILI